MVVNTWKERRYGHPALQQKLVCAEREGTGCTAQVMVLRALPAQVRVCVCVFVCVRVRVCV